MTTKKNSIKSKRFEPLDYCRGLVIALIVITEHAGNSDSYPFVSHANWVGFTIIDWLFPCLIVCMGFAMVFSLNRAKNIDGWFLRKVFTRGLLLIFIGLCLNFCDGFFSRLFEGMGPDAFMDALHNLRFYGILQRIGFVYMVGAFIIMILKKDPKKILITAGVILLAYLFILGFGNGYEWSTENIIYIVDNSFIPDSHMYHRTIDGVRLALDPEGAISMISTVAQVLLGFGIGKLFIENWKKDTEKATLALFAYSVMIIILGLAIMTFAPIIKRAWTTSFVCVTTGISFCVMALFSFLTLKKPHEKAFLFFKVFGVNALGLFVISNFLQYLTKYVPVGDQFFKYYVNEVLCTLCLGNTYLASLIYALLSMFVVFLIGLFLYRKKIFIKL